MISEELLNDVLELDLIVHDIKIVNNTLFYTTENYTNKINIYELAHKCKEWALDKGYIIESYTFFDDRSENKGYARIGKYRFPLKTEVEAIFKACQWILKNKG